MCDSDSAKSLSSLRVRARGIPDAVRVALTLNLITEEGLPHFHRLFASHVNGSSAWKEWNYTWTAEEDRHGNILRDYIRDAGLVDFRKLEEMQFGYITSGFDPAWDNDPYRVLVFTTLQERVTQISHQNTYRVSDGSEPVLQGILQGIAQDEARHYAFYRSIVAEILRIDPAGLIESAAHVMPRIDMPGINAPEFGEMADVMRREGIYTPWHYKEIVEECFNYWNFGSICGLCPDAQKALDTLLAVPLRLEKVAKYMATKQKRKSFSFTVIGGRVLDYA